MDITREMVAAAEKLAGLAFTDAERDLMLDGVRRQLGAYARLRGVAIANSVAPALRFDPQPRGAPAAPAAAPAAARATAPPMPVRPPPADREALAFAPVTELARYIHARQLSSVELTELYLRRLERYDPQLRCVVTLTPELALAQARRADAELAAGRLRGPLHGIPWGAKDLLATRGIRTTWGAGPFKDQLFDEDAAVVARLADAGAVLVAKLTLGELAWGDVWFDATTKNPWNLDEGASGSSAGSGAATAAGLVGFAIGSETWGSIVSPATRCGVTGLRPTFGRVSRAGAMALSWSMDKLGPMGRSAEDCALVFDAIRGADPRDPDAVDRPFDWVPSVNLAELRIGYLRSAFEQEHDHKAHDDQALDVLRSLGANLMPIELPDYPIDALSFILGAEAAAAFDELTRHKLDDELVRQEADAWPNELRMARLIPAVEYIQANRVRTLLIRAMAQLMDQVDLYIAPSYGGQNVLLTNLTGHPAVVLPNGFTDIGTPTSITFTGQLYDEARLLAVAKRYQDATGFHLRHPPLFEHQP